MQELDYWRLCEELNIVQAALLIVGEDPTNAEYIEGYKVDKRPYGYEAAKTAITSGLKKNTRATAHLKGSLASEIDIKDEKFKQIESVFGRSISGTLVKELDFDVNGNELGYIDDSIDLYKSTVEVDSIKEWLKSKGFTTGFFFPEPLETMDFLDPLNPRYAPKLAATVSAWQAVTDSGKKSPKQALDKWLREHAAEFNLTNDEGKPIEQAVEECSKVANWNAKGGATKTPS